MGYIGTKKEHIFFIWKTELVFRQNRVNTTKFKVHFHSEVGAILRIFKISPGVYFYTLRKTTNLSIHYAFNSFVKYSVDVDVIWRFFAGNNEEHHLRCSVEFSFCMFISCYDRLSQTI